MTPRPPRRGRPSRPGPQRRDARDDSSGTRTTLGALTGARTRTVGRRRANGPKRGPLAPVDKTETDRPHAARARRRLAGALARAVPAQLALRAHRSAVERRRRARPGRLPVDERQQHPRARLRPPPEGLQGTGRRNHGPGPLGHDHADPHRRRARRAPVDPARHGRRNPRPRPAEDQRRARVRRARPSRSR